MNQTKRETMLTFAVLFATFAACLSGLVWWDLRPSSWTERPWYAAFPPLTVLGAFAIGAAASWLWVRASDQ